MSKLTPANYLFEGMAFEESLDFPTAHNQDTITRLAQGLIDGDETAWGELYLYLSDSIAKFIERLVHIKELSWDITQDVFSYLWENRNKITHANNIKSYIYQLAKFYSFNYIRAKKRNEAYETMSLGDPLELDYSPDEIVIAKEVEILIQISLEGMPQQRRRIFQMSRYEGLSSEQIALQLNLSKRTVENHIYNVTKHLKEVIICAIVLILIG